MSQFVIMQRDKSQDIIDSDDLTSLRNDKKAEDGKDEEVSKSLK